MPAKGQPLLDELRAAGHVVASVDRKVHVTRVSRLTGANRQAIKDTKRSLLLALELEAIDARIWDQGDGPDPDGMFERWLANRK
jgi:hypothetical protein